MNTKPLLLVAALGLLACGGKDKTTTNPEPAETGAPAPAAAPEEPADAAEATEPAEEGPAAEDGDEEADLDEYMGDDDEGDEE
jgi:hypothetical protein